MTGVLQYKDHQLLQMKKSLLKLEYLRNVSETCLYDVMFMLKSMNHSTGNIIEKVGAKSKNMYYV
jgi:hypothetical protein